MQFVCDLCNRSYFMISFVVFAGTSIIDPDVYLVGASGGVYALLAAHLANVMINYHQMRYGILRLAAILFFGNCFFVCFLYYYVCTYVYNIKTLTLTHSGLMAIIFIMVHCTGSFGASSTICLFMILCVQAMLDCLY